MLGKRSTQRGLFEADHLYIDHVGRDSFYGFLASQRGQIFHDEDFAEMYCADNGRNSVPPSLLGTGLLLQTHDGVSDQEAKDRADFDLRWKVALGIGIEDRPFAKSTLQLFRAHLILHDKMGEVFQRSLAFARKTGYLKKRRMKAALHTTNILGRGAVRFL
jgi:transposase